MTKQFLCLPVILLCLCLQVSVVHAQGTFADRYNITYITMDNGLLHNFVDNIYKDKRGFLWIATSGGGLSRYDGYEFIHYNTTTNPVKLKSNFIRGAVEDRFNRLWIVSEGGIDILSLASLQLTLPGDRTGLLERLTDCSAVGVICDSKGCIWCYCGDTLYKIRFDKKGDVEEIHTLPSVLLNIPVIALDDIDEDGNIWAGLENSVCKLSEDENGQLKAVPVAQSLVLGQDIIISVFQLKENEVWIGTDQGLIRYNKNSGQVKKYNHERNRARTLSQSHVTDLAITQDKQLLVSTLRGINIYDPINDGFELITHNNSSQGSSLNSNFVNCILVDDDRIWIGTETGGINKMTPGKLSIRNYIHSNDNPAGLSDNPVNSVYEDAKGYLWVGTVEGGLNRKEPDSECFTHYTAESASALSHNSVSAITADSLGRLWVGTWGEGVSIFDINHPESRAVQYISSHNNPGFSINFVGSLCYDTLNNGMWIGCNPGIFFYDLSAGRLMMPFDGDVAGNIYGVIGSVIDRKNRLWMGCMNGMYVIDLHSRSDKGFSYRYFPYKLDHPDSHMIEKITCFCLSADGTLWLGSNGYGIYRFVPDEKNFGVFIAYTTEQGLINNNIKGILEDREGCLWITTNNGISRFDPSNNRFTNYTKEDGLASNQFYWNAYCRSKKGILYFGSLSGLTVIDPNRNSAQRNAYKVMLTKLWVANKDIIPDKRYIDSDISMAETLRLHESDKSFSLEFSALNYEPHVSAVYSYRLVGFDDEWIDVPASRRFASYTNLSEGKYTFQVKYIPEGLDAEKVPVTKLTVIVRPYFYKTPLFILSIIMTLVCSAVYWYKRRIFTLKKQHLEMGKKIDELTIDKLSFFTNITHEFRTPITLIIGPIERALKLSTNPKVIEQLHFVERNSKYLLSLVNQLMDFRKVESGKLEIVKVKENFLKFLDAIVFPFEAFAENRHIQIRKYYRLSSPEFFFDQDAMQKVITNLLSNAVKFTPDGGNVGIYVTSFFDKEIRKEKLFVGIKDTGTGIAEEDIDKIFNRFYQSKNHVKFPVYGQSGTGIGLYLSKRLIQLHGGSIAARNNRKTGATFYLALPVSVEEKMPEANKSIALPANDVSEKEVTVRFSPGKQTILIVEDNKDMRDYIQSILSDSYNTLEAGNGEKALSILSESHVDFIISDWMMPVMDGLELSRRVKENFSISHIPFLMLTAKTAQEAHLESYRTGVDGYLSKPFNEELLLARIANILENRKRYQQQFALNMNIQALHIEEESSDKKFINKALEIVKANYKDSYYESIDFIEAMGVSKSLLNKKMHNLIGQSIGQFIRNYRLNIAYELIEKNRITKNMNISEIAYEVGFNDPKYFTRCFTRRFNITPSSLLEGSL
ncbi:MAG: response regulator [Dysgonamonadaceae bacterium]|jgi:signal transduction histidine kinase/ligand-binding sensor domain-containing protein/DNA-binding NarL/FixJ family response regulator|nr:response regulator [Dysgonamonadaceae bacterium]